ncbi:hypothetical protein GCM10010345_84560 [Streptomyces canarius]|uniref:Uncharacterized protein n=1 Tax=Streptomyces canarius TaxID=285453 RepID=A0ABQ3DAH6_9ACTN|nr:hypothetical protein GCM10010345_84560 [Streptomyces canarius]
MKQLSAGTLHAQCLVPPSATNEAGAAKTASVFRGGGAPGSTGTACPRKEHRRSETAAALVAGRGHGECLLKDLLAFR